MKFEISFACAPVVASGGGKYIHVSSVCFKCFLTTDMPQRSIDPTLFCQRSDKINKNYSNHGVYNYKIIRIVT